MNQRLKFRSSLSNYLRNEGKKREGGRVENIITDKNKTDAKVGEEVGWDMAWDILHFVM